MATILPPNQFDSGAPVALITPDEAAADVSSQSPVAAAEISHSGAQDCPLDEAATALRQVDAVAADICHIGEIFVGAARLEPVEMWFENAAYPREDEILFEVLEAMNDPRTRDLPCVPDEDAFMSEVEERPLFLRQAVGA